MRNLQLNNKINKNNLTNNNININNNIYNRSSSLLYQRNNINLENINQTKNTEEIKDLNLSSHQVLQIIMLTPQRNFERSVLLTSTRRYIIL